MSDDELPEFEIGGRTFLFDLHDVRLLCLHSAVVIRAWEAEIGSKQDLADPECAAFMQSVTGADLCLIDASVQQVRQTIENCEVED